MKLFAKSTDGGDTSGVTGYFLIEWKAGFSIVLLRFAPGTREAFHSHAFNAITWWLHGKAVEEHVTGQTKQWTPALKPKFTAPDCFHRVTSVGVTWALSIRGPWVKTWKEQRQGREVTLTHGRQIVAPDQAR